MLKVSKSFMLRDHFRENQGVRSHGLQVSRNYRAIPLHGAYQDVAGTIVYFIARQIDAGDNVIKSYDIATDRIKYHDGQYIYDTSKLFDGILPVGTYFFEFNDGKDTFYSQIFAVTDAPVLNLASSVLLASGSHLVNDSNVENSNDIILKEFEGVNGYVQLENI